MTSAIVIINAKIDWYSMADKYHWRYSKLEIENGVSIELFRMMFLCLLLLLGLRCFMNLLRGRSISLLSDILNGVPSLHHVEQHLICLGIFGGWMFTGSLWADSRWTDRCCGDERARFDVFRRLGEAPIARDGGWTSIGSHGVVRVVRILICRRRGTAGALNCHMGLLWSPVWCALKGAWGNVVVMVGASHYGFRSAKDFLSRRRTGLFRVFCWRERGSALS